MTARDNLVMFYAMVVGPALYVRYHRYWYPSFLEGFRG